MTARRSDIPAFIELSEEWVRKRPALPRGCDAGERLAPAEWNNLATQIEGLYHHVKHQDGMADIYDVFIGYFNDQA